MRVGQFGLSISFSALRLLTFGPWPVLRGKMFHLIIILSSSRNWIPHANRNIWNKNRDGSRRNFSSVYLDTMRGHLTSLYFILGLSGKLFRLMSEGCSGGRGIFLNENYGDESWDRRWYRAWEDTMQGAGSGLNMILTNWQSRPPNYGHIRVVNLAHLRCQIKIPQLSHILSDFTFHTLMLGGDVGGTFNEKLMKV